MILTCCAGQKWLDLGLSPHTTGAWAILLNQLIDECGDVQVDVTSTEKLEKLPLDEVCQASDQVAEQLGAQPSIHSFLEALHTDMIQDMLASLRECREAFCRKIEDKFMSIYEKFSSGEKYKGVIHLFSRLPGVNCMR